MDRGTVVDSRGPGSRTFAALAAALVLVLQGLASAWATGQMAGPPMLDAFGNPICQEDRIGGPSPGNDHGVPSNCCTLACNAAGAAFSPPTAGVLAPPASYAVALEAARIHPPAPTRPEYNPASPRAPPPTI